MYEGKHLVVLRQSHAHEIVNSSYILKSSIDVFKVDEMGLVCVAWIISACSGGCRVI